MPVPDYLVATNKNDIIEFKKNFKIVTKPITNIQPFKYKKSDEFYIPYTAILDANAIKKLPDYFYPSFIQQYIKPKIEIKGFYLNEQITSIGQKANFSSGCKDIRQLSKFDSKFSQFTFSLPKVIESKIKLLFKRLNLNIGTFDLILDKNDNYYFLEINPSGRFDYINQIAKANIYLEIAKYLK